MRTRLYEFLRFCIVGFLGYLVDAGVMELLVHAGFTAPHARIFSILTALQCTYLLHGAFTFKAHTGYSRRAWVAFMSFNLLGALINYLVFLAALQLIHLEQAVLVRQLSLVCGMAVAMWFNYWANRHYVFGAKALPIKRYLPELAALALVTIPLLIFIASKWHAVPLSPGATIGPADPDPWLRLTLVRDWLSGGSWYSHEVARTNTPFGGISSPWTRPLDMVIALVTQLQSEAVDLSTRLIRAAMVMPLLWMTLLLAGLYRALRHLCPLPTAPFMASMLIASALTMWNYFSLANADHHAPMAALFVWVMGGVVQPYPNRRTVIFTGLLLGLHVWISPEALVLIGAIYGWYGLQWLRGDDGAFRPLPLLATSVALMTTIAVMIERAPNAWFTPIYDSVSIVHVVILSVTASLGWLLLFIWNVKNTSGANLCPPPNLPPLGGGILPASAGMERDILGFRWRALIAVGGLAILLVAIRLTYPMALRGPMVEMDPYIFTHFLPRIVEAMPLSHKPPVYIVAMLLQPLLALFICWVYITRRGIISPHQALKLGYFVGFTLLLYLNQQRWYYYLYPCVVLVLAPWLGALLAPEQASVRGRWPASMVDGKTPLDQMLQRLPIILGVVAVPLMLLIAAPRIHTKLSDEIDACQHAARQMIYGGELNRLGGKPLNVFIYTDLGAELLFWSPHRIVASNYHREGPGIRYIWEADKITTASMLKTYLAKRDIEMLVLCPTPHPAEDSVLQKLARGSVVPPWLTRVAMPATTQPAVYLVTGRP